MRRAGSDVSRGVARQDERGERDHRGERGAGRVGGSAQGHARRAARQRAVHGGGGAAGRGVARRGKRLDRRRTGSVGDLRGFQKPRRSGARTGQRRGIPGQDDPPDAGGRRALPRQQGAQVHPAGGVGAQRAPRGRRVGPTTPAAWRSPSARSTAPSRPSRWRSACARRTAAATTTWCSPASPSTARRRRRSRTTQPRVRCHQAHIRPDVAMGDLLKDTPGSQLFTVFGLPRVKLESAGKSEWTVEMEGVDIYDPVDQHRPGHRRRQGRGVVPRQRLRRPDLLHCPGVLPRRVRVGEARPRAQIGGGCRPLRRVLGHEVAAVRGREAWTDCGQGDRPARK